jgi:hypothetical protein
MNHYLAIRPKKGRVVAKIISRFFILGKFLPAQDDNIESNHSVKMVKSRFAFGKLSGLDTVFSFPRIGGAGRCTY